MASPESDTHSFILRIWSDEPEVTGERRLGGHITDAYSKNRAPVSDLADILLFIKPFIDKMGVKLSRRSSLLVAIGSLGRRKKGSRSRAAPEA